MMCSIFKESEERRYNQSFRLVHSLWEPAGLVGQFWLMESALKIISDKLLENITGNYDTAAEKNVFYI